MAVWGAEGRPISPADSRLARHFCRFGQNVQLPWVRRALYVRRTLPKTKRGNQKKKEKEKEKEEAVARSLN